jgi:hypothetical protein
MARLLSSIPLVRHGFPPVCILPVLRGTYYESMNTVGVNLFKVGDSVNTRPPRHRVPLTPRQAWEGDYQPLINCIVESIKVSLTDVDRIMA